ncbi:2109_t:CDS:1, partial [Acaulospora morrowiae]
MISHTSTPSTDSCSSYYSSSSSLSSPTSFTKFSERLDLESPTANAFDQLSLTDVIDHLQIIEGVRVVDGRKFLSDEESKYP